MFPSLSLKKIKKNKKKNLEQMKETNVTQLMITIN